MRAAGGRPTLPPPPAEGAGASTGESPQGHAWGLGGISPLTCDGQAPELLPCARCGPGACPPGLAAHWGVIATRRDCPARCSRPGARRTLRALPRNRGRGQLTVRPCPSLQPGMKSTRAMIQRRVLCVLSEASKMQDYRHKCVYPWVRAHIDQYT